MREFMGQSAEDRRRTLRAVVTGSSGLALPLSMAVQVLDISMIGALLSSPQAVSPGRRAELQTMLAGELLVLQVEVRRATERAPGRFHLGVAFVSLDDRSRRCLQRFLGQKST